MDYEKKYKEALERARKLQENSNGMILKKWLWNIFPELKESEGEKIRKWLIGYFNQYIIDGMPQVFGNGLNVKDVIAWLEKQGKKEQDVRYKHLDELLVADDIYQMAMNDTMIEEARTKAIEAISKIGISQLSGIEKQCEQKPADKNEPKFHEGDWVVSGYFVTQIREIAGDGYVNSHNGFIPFESAKYYHIWTIQDAKDGDVLACNNGWTCIFKTLVNDETFSSYCFMDKTKRFCETGSECHTLKEEFVKTYNGKIYPATKEQRDTLFAKMKEAGYAFDFEKKELKKLGQPEVTKTSDQEEIAEIPFGAKDSELQEATYFIPKGFHAEIDDDKVVIKKGEKPTAWSEEDEKRIANILSVLSVQVCWDGATGEKMNPYQKEIDWLKSLKDRVQPKQEWSEDDKKMLESIIYDFGKGRQSTTSQDNWLKSLAPWSIPKIRFV